MEIFHNSIFPCRKKGQGSVFQLLPCPISGSSFLDLPIDMFGKVQSVFLFGTEKIFTNVKYFTGILHSREVINSLKSISQTLESFLLGKYCPLLSTGWISLSNKEMIVNGIGNRVKRTVLEAKGSRVKTTNEVVTNTRERIQLS